MRFTGQNKKKLDARYFLNEAIYNQDPDFQVVVDIVQDTFMNKQVLTPPELEALDANFKKLKVLDQSNELDTYETAKKAYEFLQKRTLKGFDVPEEPISATTSLGKIATKGKGYAGKCDIARLIQTAARGIIQKSSISNKQKILKRLSDNIMGPTTLSVINLVASRIGSQKFPLNQSGFAEACSKPEGFASLVIQELLKLDPQTIAQAVTGGGSGEMYAQDDISREITESKLFESKERDNSYNRIKDEKNKKLFEALIKG